MADLEQIIASELASWNQRPVEHAIFGHSDPARIARELERCAGELLRSRVSAGLFYRASIGAVAGVELADGRRAVLKVHQPDRSREHLAEVLRLQCQLAQRGCFAPAVWAGPHPLARGHLVIERYVLEGSTRDGHEPAIRRGLARSLHALSAALEPFVSESALPPHALAELPPGRLWPPPHSKLFDFEATRAGAEEIDALAALARQRMEPAGRVVLGHSDWRAEHVRFEGDEPIAAFDWDSLCKAREPELVGFIAHAFCADWSRQGHAQAPSLQESRCFVAEYEVARGSAFSAAERRLLGAAFAYSVAYTARCGHAFGKRERDLPGAFHALLARHGQQLLAW
ncbi:MAG TPA: phosphotransferase [Polyangiaceae bacterium]|jgi:hypothetical protein|nr:phosphotransferase [Polyangiaceae bacterium]